MSIPLAASTKHNHSLDADDGLRAESGVVCDRCIIIIIISIIPPTDRQPEARSGGGGRRGQREKGRADGHTHAHSLSNQACSTGSLIHRNHSHSFLSPFLHLSFGLFPGSTTLSLTPHHTTATRTPGQTTISCPFCNPSRNNDSRDWSALALKANGCA